MLKSLYVIGGQQRSPRSLLSQNQSWYDYKRGIILRVDLENGNTKICVDYVSPSEVRSESDPVLFKSGTIWNNKLYVCTQTEVLIYLLPHFDLDGYISLTCFNDVHHVRPTPEGNLLVANSGLEMVLEITPEGEVVREWSALGEDPWTRLSKAIDYRKGISTKPHRSHPNYLFYIDDHIWVTRFEQKDAICLTSPDRCINIGIERVHDGIVYQDRIYFTTVNGHLVIANPNTLKIEEVIDLNTMNEEGVLSGWCRSILIDGALIWVGFSRIRPTKIRENVSWIRTNFKQSRPTHIACYDLHRRCRVSEKNMELHGLNAIFGIFPVPMSG
jgi:hypothetical protein